MIFSYHTYYIKLSAYLFYPIQLFSSKHSPENSLNTHIYHTSPFKETELSCYETSKQTKKKCLKYILIEQNFKIYWSFCGKISALCSVMTLPSSIGLECVMWAGVTLVTVTGAGTVRSDRKTKERRVPFLINR